MANDLPCGSDRQIANDVEGRSPSGDGSHSGSPIPCGSDRQIANRSFPSRGTHSNALRKGRSSEIGRVYAITKCTKDKQPILLLPFGGVKTAADIVFAALRHRHQSGVWSCLAYVIMPDHLHFVVKLLEGNLSGQVASFSKFTSREINLLLDRKGPTWQAGFYDHALRGDESLRATIGYIVGNPVRAGLVVRPEDWPHSAAMPNW